MREEQEIRHMHTDGACAKVRTQAPLAVDGEGVTLVTYTAERALRVDTNLLTTSIVAQTLVDVYNQSQEEQWTSNNHLL